MTVVLRMQVDQLSMKLSDSQGQNVHTEARLTLGHTNRERRFVLRFALFCGFPKTSRIAPDAIRCPCGHKEFPAQISAAAHREPRSVLAGLNYADQTCSIISNNIPIQQLAPLSHLAPNQLVFCSCSHNHVKVVTTWQHRGVKFSMSYKCNNTNFVPSNFAV